MQWSLDQFEYTLPDHQIAKFPLAQRDESKLLVYKNQRITHQSFKKLADQLPTNASLYFNNTKVIPARLVFHKEAGARIEIFLLSPLLPSHEMSLALAAKGLAQWECMVGNSKRWKINQALLQKITIDHQSFIVKAERSPEQPTIVQFTWDAPYTFAEVVEGIGKIPLPPYLNREAEQSDENSYQTVYSEIKGAVAAPTAGLHFTDAVLNDLQSKGIALNYLTLHVGAGTFQPVKTPENVQNHSMHKEQIRITRANVLALLGLGKITIPVGTTSMRSLESLYWFGVRLIQEGIHAPFFVEKLYPYQSHSKSYSKQEALQAVLHSMDAQQVDSLSGETEIFILPGYQFKICEALITNFHQPGSTLIILIAALVGPNWRTIYEEALQQNYRFLSYGDSSLLWP